MEFLNAKVKGFEQRDGKELLRVIITKEMVDREGDIIRISGAQLENYKSNPVVLFDHNSWELPIGRTTELIAKGETIEALIEFKQNNKVAEEIKEYVKDGFLKGISIGFIIKESHQRAPNREEREQGYNTIREITKWELYEVSIVIIQANAGAVVKGKEKLLLEIQELKKQIGAIMQEKAGRKLSEATQKKIKTAVSDLNSASKALNSLLTGEEVEPDKDIKNPDMKAEIEKSVTKKLEDFEKRLNEPKKINFNELREVESA